MELTRVVLDKPVDDFIELVLLLVGQLAEAGRQGIRLAGSARGTGRIIRRKDKQKKTEESGAHTLGSLFAPRGELTSASRDGGAKTLLRHFMTRKGVGLARRGHAAV